MTREELVYEVSTTLGDHIEDFDLEGIADSFNAWSPISAMKSIDDIPNELYWDIVDAHDVSGQVLA